MAFFHETKRFTLYLILMAVILIVLPIKVCSAGTMGREGKRLFPGGEGYLLSASESDVENIIIEEKNSLSLVKTFLFDLAVPGGGHFYRGDYITGSSFLALKLGGAFLAYYSIRKWNEAEDRYESRIRSGFSPGEREEAKRSYDRSAQFVTFSLAANIMVYGVSLLINYNSVKRINENAYPTINMYFSGDVDSGGERLLFGGVTFNI